MYHLRQLLELPAIRAIYFKACENFEYYYFIIIIIIYTLLWCCEADCFIYANTIYFISCQFYW